MPEHSPEPWRIEKQAFTSRGYRKPDEEHEVLVDANGLSLQYGMTIDGFNDDIAVAVWNNNDDRARAIACVNALRGLNPEVVGELVACLQDLLDLTEHAYDEGFGGGQEQSDNLIEAREKARELLAKVKA